MNRLMLIASMLILIDSHAVWSADKTDTSEQIQNDTKTYLIVFGSPQNPEHVKSYQTAAGPILKEYGALLPPTMQLRVNQVILGNSDPAFMSILEFPDAKSIQNAFHDPRYLALVDERDSGFKDLNIMIVSQ